MPLELSVPAIRFILGLERAWPGFNTVCSRHYLPTPRHKMSSGMRRLTSRAGIALVSLKRRRSSACIDAGKSAICLSSNRHDRGNEQQTSGVARARGPRGGQRTRRIKIEIIDAQRQSPTSTDSDARQEIAVKIQARPRNSALHTDRTMVTRDHVPEKPQRRHHRSDPVHVERREDVRRESVAGLPGFCYLLDQPEHGDRRWLTG